jgi:ribose 5-phosphate isomerase B
MNISTIAIGSDHAGYELKEQLKIWLTGKGYTINDYGTFSAESVDYPDFIHPVAQSVGDLTADVGIVICGSGNGAAITANKHQNIRAALCWNVEIARFAKEHNNANIISLPARYISAELAKDIVSAYLSATFEGGRHKVRIDKIPYKCC